MEMELEPTSSHPSRGPYQKKVTARSGRPRPLRPLLRILLCASLLAGISQQWRLVFVPAQAKQEATNSRFRRTQAHAEPTARNAPEAGSTSGGDDTEAEDERYGPDKAPTRGVGLAKRLRERLAEGIQEQQSQVDFIPTEDQKRIVRQEVDLNGVSPVTCILGSVPVFGLSYGFWQFTNAAAAWFVSHPLETDFYPVQRLGVVFQTAVIGLSSLAAGIFGFTALGLLLLGLRVTYGTITGELDPNKESTGPVRQSTMEKVRDLLTKDPVEVAMARRRTMTSPDKGPDEST